MEKIEDILIGDQNWTSQRYKVQEAIARKFPNVRVEVVGDEILVHEDGVIVLVEKIRRDTYRTKTNAAGHPREIVGGGVEVIAAKLIDQIRMDIADMTKRQSKRKATV